MIRCVVVTLVCLGEKRGVRYEERWRWVWSFAIEMYGCVDVGTCTISQVLLVYKNFLCLGVRSPCSIFYNLQTEQD